LKRETIAVCFHKLGKVFWDGLRLKINLRAGTKMSEHLFITKLVIPSSPTNLVGRSRFIPLWTSEFETRAEDNSSADWFIKEKYSRAGTTINGLKMFWKFLRNITRIIY
jgi:hypothetical protein